MAESPAVLHLDLLTTKEVASILRLSHQAVMRLIWAKKIPHYRFGKRTVRVRRAELERWIASCETPRPPRGKSEVVTHQ